MKKLAFVLYVGCVLAFSAFARADVIMPYLKSSNHPIAIDLVEVDQRNLEVRVSGYLPTPGYKTLSATLSPDLKQPNVLVLRLSSPIPDGTWTENRVPYVTIVSLPVVAQNTVVGLEEKSLYRIETDKQEFVMQVTGAELMRVPGFVAQ